MFELDVWKAAAVPAKLPVTPTGRASRSVADLSAATASLSALPGARSNDRVIAGIWPAWLMVGGAVPRVTVVTALKGTIAPLAPLRYRRDRADGSVWYCGSSSRMTWY